MFVTKSKVNCDWKGWFSHLMKMTTNLSGSNRYFSSLLSYSTPEWLQDGILISPKRRVKFAISDTPIHHWKLPGIPDGYEVYIKRDDMTGSTLSGNKVRKLEFLFADALQQGCKHIITCGGFQSNHCRATAIAAAQMGLKCHLVLRGLDESFNNLACEGNMFLNRMCGADVYYVPRVAPYETHLKPCMDLLAKKIREETGEKCYIVPVGGSNAVGFFGYIDGFRELVDQGVCDEFDDVVVACGSGGTAEGLSVGNYMTGSKLKIHAVAVCDDAKYFHHHANEIYQELSLKGVRSEDMMEVIEGYKGRGYGISSDNELDFITDVSAKTGIILDPTYTGKAALGLVQELQNNPQRFRGHKILFIHTGGVFGAFDGRLNTSLLKDTATSRCFSWADIDNPPF